MQRVCRALRLSGNGPSRPRRQISRMLPSRLSIETGGRKTWDAAGNAPHVLQKVAVIRYLGMINKTNRRESIPSYEKRRDEVDTARYSSMRELNL